MTTLHYEIRDMDLQAHEFVVRLRIAAVQVDGQLLTLPAWIPGSYMIRDFARNITAFSAHDSRGPVAVDKLDKQTWRLGPVEGDLSVDYRVYAFDLSVRSAYLDQTRAYFNGTSLLLRVVGWEQAPWTLTIGRPRGAIPPGWRVATAFGASDIDAAGFGVYAGAGYRRLVDCPVEIADFEDAEFGVVGVPHRFVVSDGGRFDMARICRDLSHICAHHVGMFGELPVQRYVFMTLAVADGYGGLEHADSTSLVCRRADLPVPGLGKPDKGYRRFLALCSHEYFHLWNVKRIVPQRLQAADLAAETHTELLWAFEGITSYYDELALVRSGVLDAHDYLDLFATTVTRVIRNSGRLRQSIAESSFDAWTRFYKQDENAPNAIVSYYTKGALVAFGLDLTLRECSDGRLTLDDLMRRLWNRYGKRGEGVPERTIEREAEKLLGAPVDDFFARYVYGTDELPLQAWFDAVGIGYRARPARDSDDLGGYRGDGDDVDPGPDLGARFEAQPVGLCLTQVITGGAAQCAGLAPGDLLIAVDGERATASNLRGLLRRMEGKPAVVHAFRRDRLIELRLPVQPAVADTCELWLLPDEELDGVRLARRRAWLGSERKAGG